MAAQISDRQFSKALQGLDDSYLACRDMRHAWEVSDDFHVAEDGKGRSRVCRVLVCYRCGTVRTEWYSPTRSKGLVRQGITYTYAEGYRLHGFPRGVTPAVLIAGERYRRSLEHAADQARKAV